MDGKGHKEISFNSTSDAIRGLAGRDAMHGQTSEYPEKRTGLDIRGSSIPFTFKINYIQSQNKANIRQTPHSSRPPKISGT